MDEFDGVPVDAAGGRYRERPIVAGRTALLSIDMQNMECGTDLRRRAREAGTPEHAKAWFFRRIDEVVIPAQQRLLAAARPEKYGSKASGHSKNHPEGIDVTAIVRTVLEELVAAATGESDGADSEPVALPGDERGGTD